MKAQTPHLSANSESLKTLEAPLEKCGTLLERIELEKLNMASNMLKVIAHPVRLAIVDAIHKNERLTVSQIQEMIGLEQAIASQQLTLMQDKGVLSSEKVGRNRFFFLRHPNMIKIVCCLEDCCNTL